MNASKQKKTYRVVQWATGNVGSRALRRVIEHPGLELVGLLVTSDAKVGKDAGELCGLDYEVGIKATKSVDAIVVMDADCILYMPAYTNFGDVARLLESGKNVVTPRGEFLHPAGLSPDNRALIEEACRKGGTSIHSTGSSPGFITEALPIPLIAQQRRLDCLTINEYADCSSRDSPDMLFNLMGFGVSPGQFRQAMLEHVKHDFAGSLIQLAEAANMPLDDMTVEGEMAVANNDIEIAAGKVEAGTVAGLRITVTGMHKGKPLMRFRAHWYVSRDIDKDWDLLHSGWRVKVEGDVPMDLQISFPVPLEDYAAFTPGITANRPVNAVAAVCAAEPGIRTTMELPQIIATF